MKAAVVVDRPAPHVNRLAIANTDRRGALSLDVVAALTSELGTPPDDVGCLLLTGSGTTFCAGYDLKALTSPPCPKHADTTIAPDSAELFDLLEQQPLPVVAALNGPAFGGGLELALASDVRIAIPGATMGAPAGRLGLVYSPGGLERLMRELPFAIAADLLLAGGTISAERAYELALVNRIVEPDELQDVAVATARRIAELAPLAVRANRRALRALRRSSPVFDDTTRSGLLNSRREGMRSADFAEGVGAFHERRTPRFVGE